MAPADMTAENIDYYISPKKKYFDFGIGFLAAGLFWLAVFHPYWYVGPILIFIASAVAIKKKVTRKYIAYGALGLLFSPFALWWSSFLFLMGSREQ